MQQFDVFWKLLENFQGNDCDENHFQERIQVWVPFYQFSEYLFIVASKHWIERIPLNDNIVWYSHQRFVKKWKFFLLNAPKYLGTRLLHSLYVQTLRIFWNVFLSKKKTKKKKTIREDKSSQNFLKSLV